MHEENAEVKQYHKDDDDVRPVTRAPLEECSGSRQRRAYITALFSGSHFAQSLIAPVPMEK
jgi:hypothetical protein